MSANGARRHGFPTILPATALAIAAFLTAPSAQAQFVFEEAILPPRAVAWRLADRGFTPLGRARFDGRAYVVEAMSPGGARVRLFVDPGDGAIVGRQRLDPPVMAYNRFAAPGYGWTEDDARPPVPPAEIPGAGRTRVEPRARSEANVGIDGLNPDPRSKPEPPRRSARLAAPEKPRPSARTVPEAPKPNLPETLPETAPTGSVAKPEGPSATPKAPADAGSAPAASNPDAASTAVPPAAEKRDDATWKDPPADGSRKVRVIGGATVVPGTTDREPGTAR